MAGEASRLRGPVAGTLSDGRGTTPLSTPRHTRELSRAPRTVAKPCGLHAPLWTRRGRRQDDAAHGRRRLLCRAPTSSLCGGRSLAASRARRRGPTDGTGTTPFIRRDQNPSSHELAERWRSLAASMRRCLSVDATMRATRRHRTWAWTPPGRSSQELFERWRKPCGFSAPPSGDNLRDDDVERCGRRDDLETDACTELSRAHTTVAEAFRLPWLPSPTTETFPLGASRPF